MRFVRRSRASRQDVATVYDRLAGRYDLLGALWDHTIARSAVGCFRTQVRQRVQPGAYVLDVGAGTGRSIALLLEEARPGRVVGVDVSVGMLAKAGGRLDDGSGRVALVRADATRLPFPDDTFDVVTSMWMLETSPDPSAVVWECLRVLRPTGLLLVVFNGLPPRGALRIGARAVELIMEPGFAGRFLREEEQPLCHCPMSCARRYRHGLATVATFGKDCRWYLSSRER